MLSLSLSLSLCHTCYSGYFIYLCRDLHRAAPDTCLWGAGVILLSFLPTCLRVVDTLRTPLRCPPVVQREVALSCLIDGRATPRYSQAAWPSPTEGPAVRWLKHDGQPGHGGGHPQDCQQCGLEVGRLLHHLGVGQSGRCHGTASNTDSTGHYFYCCYCDYHHCYFYYRYCGSSCSRGSSSGSSSSSGCQ